MKKLLIAMLVLAVCATAFESEGRTRKRSRRRAPRYEQVQGTPSEVDKRQCEDEAVTVTPDAYPQFPGGTEALVKFISANLEYPEQALRDSIEGKVLLQFVVEENGRVGRIKVARSVHRWLDNEAMRVVSILPPFIPAKVDGKPVACWFTLPINFAIPVDE